jgi:hypothetical protein
MPPGISAWMGDAKPDINRPCEEGDGAATSSKSKITAKSWDWRRNRFSGRFSSIVFARRIFKKISRAFRRTDAPKDKQG